MVYKASPRTLKLQNFSITKTDQYVSWHHASVYPPRYVSYILYNNPSTSMVVMVTMLLSCAQDIREPINIAYLVRVFH